MKIRSNKKVYNDFGAVIPVAETISEPTTITVGATGCDYTSIEAAWNSLQGVIIQAAVTIDVDPSTGALDIITLAAHPYGSMITIQGDTRFDECGLKFQLSGNFVAVDGECTVTLAGGAEVPDVGIVPETDYVCICGKPTSTANNGRFQITAVDIENGTVTYSNPSAVSEVIIAGTVCLYFLPNVYRSNYTILSGEAGTTVNFHGFWFQGDRNMFGVVKNWYPLSGAGEYELGLHNCVITGGKGGISLDDGGCLACVADVGIIDNTYGVLFKRSVSSLKDIWIYNCPTGITADESTLRLLALEGCHLIDGSTGISLANKSHFLTEDTSNMSLDTFTTGIYLSGLSTALHDSGMGFTDCDTEWAVEDNSNAVVYDNNGVVETSKVEADTVDTYHASQTPTADTIPVADEDGLLDPAWVSFAPITDDITLTVGSGKDYETIQEAWDSLAGRVISGTVTIQLDEGTYSELLELTPHPNGDRITIQGNTDCTPIPLANLESLGEGEVRITLSEGWPEWFDENCYFVLVGVCERDCYYEIRKPTSIDAEKLTITYNSSSGSSVADPTELSFMPCPTRVFYPGSGQNSLNISCSMDSPAGAVQMQGVWFRAGGSRNTEAATVVGNCVLQLRDVVFGAIASEEGFSNTAIQLYNGAKLSGDCRNVVIYRYNTGILFQRTGNFSTGGFYIARSVYTGLHFTVCNDISFGLSSPNGDEAVSYILHTMTVNKGILVTGSRGISLDCVTVGYCPVGLYVQNCSEVTLAGEDNYFLENGTDYTVDDQSAIFNTDGEKILSTSFIPTPSEPSDGDVLTYSDGDSEWVASTPTACIPLPESPVEGDVLQYDGENWIPSSSMDTPSAPTIDVSTGSGGIITVSASVSEEYVDGFELVHDPSDATDPDTLSPVFSKTGNWEFPAKESVFVWVRSCVGTSHSEWVTIPLHSVEYNEDPISGVEGADVAGFSHQGAGNKLIYSSSSPAPPGESMYITSNTSQQVRSYDIWTVASGITATEYGFKLTTSNHWMNSNYTNRMCGVLFGARSEIFTTFATEAFYLCYLLHNGANSVVACLSSFVGTVETNIYTSANIWSSASIQINGWNDVIVERNGENVTMHVNGIKVLDQTPSTIPASSSRVYLGLVHNGNNTMTLPYGNVMLVESRNGVTTAIAPGKVADADLLDGHDTSYFATADHTQALAKGGTNADLSATGGIAKVLRQESTGADITVGNLKLTECTAGANNTWTKFTDFAGTGEVNALKLNASDELEVGGPINLPGPIDFPADAGVVTLFDMPVVSAVDETLMAVAMKIAGQVVARILGYSTGSGAIDKLALQIAGDLLPTTTNVSCLGSSTLGYKELHLHDGANEKKITVDADGNLVTTAE